MAFEKICALNDLELTMQRFCEVSRILTKHCANYEAQEMVKNIRALLEPVSNEKIATEKVLSVQVNALIQVVNFLIDTLEEYKDSLTTEEIKFEDCLNGLAKSVVLVCRVVDLLKKFQYKHFDNLFDISQLQKIVQTVKEIAETENLESDSVTLAKAAEKMTMVHNKIIRITIGYLKFAVAHHLKKSDGLC